MNPLRPLQTLYAQAGGPASMRLSWGGACRYYPFGQGSGERVKQDFGLPHLIRFPILPELSEAGDGEVSPAMEFVSRCWLMCPG